MSRRLILGLAVAALAGRALAAAHGEKAEEKESGDGLYVDISPVGLPIIWKGRLLNYVFTSVRLNLVGNANVVGLRTKEPYFRDALVRAAHRTPFTVPTDFTKIDEAALKRVMAAEAARIVGPRAVANVQVTSQTPKKRTGFPSF
jgi:hypothetical protein